jgi:hypothetical protein
MQAAAEVKFDALCMPAEVVVMVQDQNAAVRRAAGAKEMRGREAADAAADDDES